MHKPESIPENETHKILWNSKILTICSIPARRPDTVLINKKKKRSCHLIYIVVLSENKKKTKKTEKYLGLARWPSQLGL